MGRKQGEYEKANRSYIYAIEIGERILDPSHPDVASIRSSWAGLLTKQVIMQSSTQVIWIPYRR